MSEDLHNEKLPVNADDGWKQMQELLDKHLPVQKPVTYRSKLMPYAGVALLILMLVVTFTLLNESVFEPIAGIKISTNAIEDKGAPNKPMVSHSETENGLNQTAFSSEKTSAASPAPVAVSYPLEKTNLNPGAGSRKDIQAAANAALHTPANKTGKADQNTTEERRTPSLEEKIVEEKAQTGEVADEPATTADSSQEQSVAEQPAIAKKSTKKSNWNLYGGLSVNFTLSGSAKNFQPYPVAEATYAITPRLYLSTGVAVYAPVETNSTIKGRPVYINDTVSNIRMYNEKLSYQQFHYLDIPLAIGMNITKHLSVQSGLQLSVLLNKKKEKSIEQYDFQMNSVRVPVYTSLAPMLPPEPVEEVKISKTDVRFHAGLKYHFKKFSAGATYQQGLQPVISNTTKGNKNSVFALSLLFKIK